VLNCPEPEISHDFEGDSPDIPDLDISLDPITDEEVARAIRKLKNGKAAGSDHIQPELLKHAECRVNHSAPDKPVQHCMAKTRSAHRLEGWHNYTSPEKR